MGSGGGYHGSFEPNWDEMSPEEKQNYLNEQRQRQIRQREYEARQQRQKAYEASERKKSIILWTCLAIVAVVIVIVVIVCAVNGTKK